jgi:hypothetical protein
MVSIAQPVRLAPKVMASGDSERVPRRPTKVYTAQSTLQPMISHSPRPTSPVSNRRGSPLVTTSRQPNMASTMPAALLGDIGAPKRSQSLAATTAGVRATTSAPRPASIILRP